MSETSQIIAEIVEGNGLTMGQAARLYPSHRGTGRASPSCLWRQVVQGHKLPDGTVVKLEAAKFAGRWLTTKGALARFLERVTVASSPTSTSAPSIATPRTPNRRSKASEAAAARLDAMGA